MNPMEMIVLVVAIIAFANIVKARYGGRNAPREADDRGADEAYRLRDEVKQLKDRLAVLERITIEKENSLEQEIARLREG